MNALKKSLENFKKAVQSPFAPVLRQEQRQMLMAAGMTNGQIDRAIMGSGGIRKLAKSRIADPDAGIPALAVKARELLALGKSLSDVCQELGVESNVLRPWLNNWSL